MNKNLLIFFFLVNFIITSFGQVQIYAKYTYKGTMNPVINIYGTKKISDNFKFSYFSLVEKSWAEGLAGITYSPVKWVELDFKCGIETSLSIYRLSTSIWAGNDNISFFLTFEKGDGIKNWWYKSIFNFAPSDKIAFGLISWRYTGTGPFLKYNFNKIGLAIWINPVYDSEFKEYRCLLGFDIKI